MNDFKSVKGHEHVVKNLISALNHGKTSHAYIISGIEGVGKMTVAKAFARALECESYNGDSCGKGISGRAFDSGNHPDVFYVKPTKTKSLGVEDIREQLIKNSEIKQYKYKYKVFIVDDADTMTIPAQNALLKTLEEPPQYVVILLLAQSSASFLPTILSRCVELKLNPLSSAEIKAYLEKNEGIDTNRADFYAEYAQGSIGRALKLYSSEDFGKKREDVINSLLTAVNGDLIEAMGSAKNIEPYKGDSSVLDIALMFFRDVLVYKATKDEDRVIQKDIFEDIKKTARKLDTERIIKCFDAVSEAEKQLKQNANFTLVAEVMLMRINDRKA